MSDDLSVILKIRVSRELEKALLARAKAETRTLSNMARVLLEAALARKKA